MPFSAAPTADEHSQARSRMQSVVIGTRLTLAVGVAALAYVAATWAEPHRTTILVLIVVTAAWACVPIVVGVERVVDSARREALFVGWSAGCIVLIAALSAADGGAHSPFALLFFPPLVFAALCYPLPSVAAVGTLDVLAFAVTGLLAGNASQAHIAFFATVLAATALLCAWKALDEERQR